MKKIKLVSPRLRFNPALWAIMIVGVIAVVLLFSSINFTYINSNTSAELRHIYNLFAVVFCLIVTGAMVVLYAVERKRKKAEQTLAESEYDLAATLGSLGEAVIATDPWGRITRMNPAAEHLTEWSVAEATGRKLKRIFDVLSIEDSNSAFELVEDVMSGSGHRKVNQQCRLCTRGGATIPISFNCSAIDTGSEDGPQGVVLVFRNITEELHHSRDIEHINSVLQAIRSIDLLIAHEQDSQRLIRQACGRLIQIKGYKLASILLFDSDQKVVGGASAGMDSIWPRIYSFATRTKYPACHKWLFHPKANFTVDAGELDCCGECEIKDVCHDEGVQIIRLEHMDKAYGLMTIKFDDPTGFAKQEKVLLKEMAGDIALALNAIDERRLRASVQEALARSEKNYQMLFESMVDGFASLEIVMDDNSQPSDFRFLKINPALERILEMNNSEVLGKSLKDVFPKTERRWSAICSRVVDSGQSLRFDTYSNDISKHVEVAVFKPAEDRLAVTIIDITERKQLEMQLRQSQKMEAVGQLAGGIAHDFNNQLGGIMGYAELIKRRTEDEKLAEYSEIIINSCQHASNLTAQLLAFARKGKFENIQVDLHKVIGEVVGLLSHSIDKRIELDTDLRAEESFTEGDPTQLQNALLNLGLNARDAIEGHGKITIASRNVELDHLYCITTGRELRPGTYLQITVSDTGCGISQESMPHIFEPFFTTKNVGSGTGMGLAAVYGTIEGHNAAIEVDSVTGKGTTFKLLFPLVLKDERRQLIVKMSEPVKGSGHIMVVDDEARLRKMAHELLSTLGYSVTACADGVEALEVYRKNHKNIDLVVIDMMMPKMNGKDTFLKMQEINPEVKAVLVSGYSLNSSVQKLLKDGVLGFIQKPFNASDFSRKIAEGIIGRAIISGDNPS